jgi:hypothetical protein
VNKKQHGLKHKYFSKEQRRPMNHVYKTPTKQKISGQSRNEGFQVPTQLA